MPLPPHHCFLSEELSAICPQAFIFLFSLSFIVLAYKFESRGLVLLSPNCASGAYGNSQWTAGAQYVQRVGVWSQLCATCHAALIL